jgi:L-ascorbate metabolism protein UlaG (beta-lactamase superfamily)
MLENVEVLYHSSIKIKDNKIIYIDLFKIDKDYNDADIVFITHDHFDHYSEEDIDKVINENTTIIIPEELFQ